MTPKEELLKEIKGILETCRNGFCIHRMSCYRRDTYSIGTPDCMAWRLLEAKVKEEK